MPSSKAIDKLRAEIVRRHDRFSPRLKQVARFVLENPNDMGFESLSDIAVRCDVRPSTIVRFAKALGFKGGSALQRLFRDELLASSSSHAYSARIKGLSWLERAGAELRITVVIGGEPAVIEGDLQLEVRFAAGEREQLIGLV